MSTGIVNWHWREKDVKPLVFLPANYPPLFTLSYSWAEQWLRSQIEGLSVEDVSIEQLSELEGDCNCSPFFRKLRQFPDVLKWGCASPN